MIASQPANGVKVLSLNRPAKRNALSQELIGELLRELASASADDSVKAIIITGSTSFFCGTCDWKEKIYTPMLLSLLSLHRGVDHVRGHGTLILMWGSWRGHQGDI